MLFICEDLPGSLTLIEKLAKPMKPNEVIFLTTEEMEVMNNARVIGLECTHEEEEEEVVIPND